MGTISVEEIDYEHLKESASEATSLLKSLSHSDRLLLLCQLLDGAACVSELEQMTGIEQPSLSQQLGILRKKNLVSTHREGRRIYYQINSHEALAVMKVLYSIYCGSQD